MHFREKGLQKGNPSWNNIIAIFHEIICDIFGGNLVHKQCFTTFSDLCWSMAMAHNSFKLNGNRHPSTCIYLYQEKKRSTESKHWRRILGEEIVYFCKLGHTDNGDSFGPWPFRSKIDWIRRGIIWIRSCPLFFLLIW